MSTRNLTDDSTSTFAQEMEAHFARLRRTEVKLILSVLSVVVLMLLAVML
ncbi:MAG: hypothetical protein M3P53_02390 [Actinomycetota bacterium]|nr:hypothetical protein [Actinomycetota bacterium]